MNDIKLSELETFYSETYASGMEAGLKIGYALAKSKAQRASPSYLGRKMPVAGPHDQHPRRRRGDLYPKIGDPFLSE